MEYSRHIFYNTPYPVLQYNDNFYNYCNYTDKAIIYCRSHERLRLKVFQYASDTELIEMWKNLLGYCR